MDLLMSAKYDAGTRNVIIDKRLVAEDFFILSTGLAGEILQNTSTTAGASSFGEIIPVIRASP